MLALLSFVLKLTTPMGGLVKTEKGPVPCLILLISLDQKPVTKFAWPQLTLGAHAQRGLQ